MKLLTTDVARILATQGFVAPDRDIAEVTHRLNALLAQFRDLEARYPFPDEPWPSLAWPEERADV